MSLPFGGQPQGPATACRGGDGSEKTYFLLLQKGFQCGVNPALSFAKGRPDRWGQISRQAPASMLGFTLKNRAVFIGCPLFWVMLTSFSAWSVIKDATPDSARGEKSKFKVCS